MHGSYVFTCVKSSDIDLANKALCAGQEDWVRVPSHGLRGWISVVQGSVGVAGISRHQLRVLSGVVGPRAQVCGEPGRACVV